MNKTFNFRSVYGILTYGDLNNEEIVNYNSINQMLNGITPKVEKFIISKRFNNDQCFDFIVWFKLLSSPDIKKYSKFDISGIHPQIRSISKSECCKIINSLMNEKNCEHNLNDEDLSKNTSKLNNKTKSYSKLAESCLNGNMKEGIKQFAIDQPLEFLTKGKSILSNSSMYSSIIGNNPKYKIENFNIPDSIINWKNNLSECKSLFLFGKSGIGKTQLIKTLFPDHFYCSNFS